MSGDDVVERPLHVQHHRVQFARRPRDLDPPRLVVQLDQAERLGQPPGRVDGEDDDAPAGLRRGQRQRRRRRRLAHAAGAAADDDPGLRVVDQGPEVQRRGERSGAGRGRGVPRVPFGVRRLRGHAATSVRRWSSSRRPARTAQPRSTVPVSSGSSTVGRPSASTSSRSASCAAQRRACSVTSATSASAIASAPGRCAAASAGASSAPVSSARAARARVVLGQHRLGRHVDDHRADRQRGLVQFRDRVGGLLHRHVLQQRHQVHRGLRRPQHRHDAVALGLDRAGAWPAAPSRR